MIGIDIMHKVSNNKNEKLNILLASFKCINRSNHNYKRYGKLREQKFIKDFPINMKEMLIEKDFHFYECKDCRYVCTISNNDWNKYHYAKNDIY